MDAKYVATFLLVAVMITRIQCGPGDVCPALKKCMNDSEIMFQNVSNPVDANRKFFDTLCSNIDALVNCYNYLTNCSALQAIFPIQSNADNLKDRLTKVCAQKKGLFDLYECVAKGGVSESISQCTKMVDKQSINQETTKVCSALSEILKCYAITGQCSADAVSYLGSTIQEQYGIVCSAPKMVVNVLLLCMLYLLNRFLLF